MEDLGIHLKTGEIIMNCGCIPHINLFSFTYPNFSFVNHNWLSEVIFYIFNNLFGLFSLIYFKIILVIISWLIILKVSLSKGSKFWATTFSVVFLSLFSNRFRVRPELFSYLLIVLFLYIIEQYRSKKNKKLLYLLPLLELFWVNLHIYFILGIGIFGAFFLEHLVLHKSRFNRQLLIIFITIIAATFLNPNFIKGALMPFTIFTNYGAPVIENLSFSAINAQTSAYFFTTYLFAALAILLIISFLILKEQWKNDLFYILIGLFGVILGFSITRGIAIFLLLSYIPIVENFTLITKKYQSKIGLEMKIILYFFIGIITLVFIIVNTRNVFQVPNYFASFAQDAKAGADFFIQNNIKGPVFNNYDVGSYLVYRLYPRERVYLFTRPEAFPAQFLKDYFYQTSENKDAFEKEVKKYKINALFIYLTSEGTIFLEKIHEDPNWVPVYFDNATAIFVRNNEANKAIIKKYQALLQR